MAPPTAMAAETPQIENPRGERSRPFAIEAEPFAGDEIHHRPIDQVGLDDGGDAAQEERASEAELPGRGHGEHSAENDDRDFDVKLGPHRVLHGLGKARKEIGDDQPGDEREDIAALIGQLERPAHPELLLFSRGHRGEIGKIADHPARIGNPEYGRESKGEPLHIAPEQRGAGTEHDQERQVRGDQRVVAAKGGKILRCCLQCLAEIAPHRSAHHPADQVDIDQSGQRQNKDGKAEHHGKPIFGDRGGDHIGAARAQFVNGCVGHELCSPQDRPSC
jgi:hypothetical protein